MPALIQRLKHFHLLSLPQISYYLIFLAGVILLYGRAIFFDLTFFDDHSWVKDAHALLSGGIPWWTFFSRPDLLTEFFYRPLLNLSFALDARTGHGSLVSYHLTNLIIHWINVCLVLRVLKEWGLSFSRALAGALIFLVHPVLVQAVAWIPGRTDSLLGLFCFSGLLFFLRYLRLHRLWDLAAYALCLAGAVLTKETGAALGFFTAAMSIVPDHFNRISWVQRIRAVVLTACVLGVWLIIRGYVLRESADISFNTGFQKFTENLPALALHLGKVFWPVNLSVFPILKDSNLIYGLGAALVFLGWVLLSGHKNVGKVFWACAWFVLFLIPPLVFGGIHYEYRLYVPLLGVVIVCLELFPSCMSRIISGLLTVMIIGILAVTSWHYSAAYKDQWSFWPRAAAQAPHSALAQRNLGAMYHVKGEADAAFEYYQKALALNPKEEIVHNNLGLLYQVAGNDTKAAEHFKTEIQNHPANYLAYYNLSLIMIHQNRLDEAARLLKAAAVLGPEDADVTNRLIEVQIRQERADADKK